MRREMDSMMGALSFRDPYFSSFPLTSPRDFFDDYAPSFPVDMVSDPQCCSRPLYCSSKLA